MKYVVTFEKGDGSCESFTVYNNASCVALAVEEAKEKANELHNCPYDYYLNSNVVSVVRV